MKQLIFITTLLLLLTSCVGKKELISDFDLTITVSQPNISVDRAESVQIKVKNNSEDITDESEIFFIEDGKEIVVDYGEFTAEKSGEYRFFARYGGELSSDYATVEAYDDSQLTEKYYRRNLIMKFTGTWCANCPAMGEAIKSVEHSMPNRVVEIAMHCMDELAVDESATIASDYSFESLPVSFIDMGYSTNSSSASVISSLIEKSINSNPVVAGLRISSEVVSDSLNIEIGVKSNKAEQYKVVVVLVSDNYNFTQAGADNLNYKQNSVLRSSLSNIYGDEVVVDLIDKEKMKNYSVKLTSEILTSQSRVVAYILNRVDGKYIVNNVSQCAVGESIDYMYEIK